MKMSTKKLLPCLALSAALTLISAGRTAAQTSGTWGNVGALPVAINGQYTVGAPLLPTQMYFRLFEHLSQ
jgi:hypothetical protein